MPEIRRMVEVLVRGPHEREAARRAVAEILRCSAAEVGWATDTGGTKHALDIFVRGTGFRTQVTLSLEAGSDSPVKTDLDLARALADKFKEDALLLADPTAPGMEPFHGLLARPGGRVYRVPLRELPPDGMGIDEETGSWQEWILRA
ncbi:MAG: hypothetical protein Q8T11_06025 [Elusimicrobiota bacterium]|nr:hypothetical protein [Elusimicrobiota bacterium]